MSVFGENGRARDLPPLYLIADQATCSDRPLVDVLARTLDAGVRMVQLREKALAAEVLRRLAAEVLVVTARYDAILLINSRADLAAQVGAHGVHLPAAELPSAVRAQFGAPFVIGYSAHSPEELAGAGGADFVTYSPVFTPGSKPGYAGPEVGLDGLRAAVASAAMPAYALGGITPERTRDCREAGCAGVAVMSGILAADDPGAAVRQFLTAWGDVV